jgi:hypothetical protein
MAQDYLDLFIACNSFYFYFDREKAEQEADKIRKRGKRAEIYKERDRWTVFVFNY